MNEEMLRVELNDGEVLEGIEIEMPEHFLSDMGLPKNAKSMFSGIWLLHSNSQKVSFLAHDHIKSKTIM